MFSDNYPPEGFTLAQWLEVRDVLWLIGHPHRTKPTDRRYHVYNLATAMNYIQEHYKKQANAVGTKGDLKNYIFIFLFFKTFLAYFKFKICIYS